MKLKLFLIAASAMALASCSSDSVIQENAEANAIKFAVSSSNASRSANYYCNTLMPEQFDVWGTVDGKSYFAKESYTAVSSNIYAPADRNYRYWPQNEIKFYAAKNYGTNVGWAKGTTDFELKFTDFTPATKADEQVDFIYAFNGGQRNTTNANTAPLPMNFRHALSQIVFKAQKKNTKIYVEIKGVKICNVASKGDFALPTGDNYTTGVDYNYTDHSQAPAPSEAQRKGNGTWNIKSENAAAGEYSVVLASNVVLPQDGSVKNLTDQDPAHVEADDAATKFLKAFMIIPQEKGAYKPLKDANPQGVAADTDKGAYFRLDCRIYNISGNSFDPATDVCLWGGAVGDDGMAAFKELAIPVAPKWDWGKKYIYTFVFNTNGHGGYDPDNGKEVLVPIDLAVTVDDFADSTAGSITIDDVNP